MSVRLFFFGRAAIIFTSTPPPDSCLFFCFSPLSAVASLKRNHAMALMIKSLFDFEAGTPAELSFPEVSTFLRGEPLTQHSCSIYIYRVPS